MTSNEDDDRGMKLTQPNPAMLFDMMRIYASNVNMDTEADWTENGNFKPISALTDNVEFGGIQFHTAHRENEAVALANPAMNYEFKESYSTFMDRRRKWQTSKFRRIAVNQIPAPAADNTIVGNNFDDIWDFLHLRAEMDWFNEPVAQARVFCQFIQDSTNFGELDFEAGPETAIFNDVRINRGPGNAAAPTNAATVPDLHTKLWFPRMYELARANIIIREPDVSGVCYLTAKHTLTNSRITFYYKHNDTANAATREVVALPQALTRGYRAREGPWFNVDNAGLANPDGPVSTIWQSTYDYRTIVMSGYADYIRDQYYIQSGSN
jgi:hypothetical protein